MTRQPKRPPRQFTRYVWIGVDPVAGGLVFHWSNTRILRQEEIINDTLCRRYTLDSKRKAKR
jgi:hypothetical protein